MDKESLRIARNIITDAISKSDIELIDKIELMLNIYAFLDNEDYNDNIKTLAKRKNMKRKWENGK